MRLVLVFCLGALLTQNLQAESENKLKAAFTYNFAKYVFWPANIETAGGELRLCVFRNTDLVRELERISGRTVRNFELSIKPIDDIDQLAGCQALFISSKKYQQRLLDAAAKGPILTISDLEDFTVNGGMIQLITEERQIRFNINLKEAKNRGLQISSRLLQLAKDVHR